jgi:hypothetical protein
VFPSDVDQLLGDLSVTPLLPFDARAWGSGANGFKNGIVRSLPARGGTCSHRARLLASPGIVGTQCKSCL